METKRTRMENAFCTVNKDSSYPCEDDIKLGRKKNNPNATWKRVHSVFWIKLTWDVLNVNVSQSKGEVDEHKCFFKSRISAGAVEQ